MGGKAPVRKNPGRKAKENGVGAENHVSREESAEDYGDTDQHGGEGKEQRTQNNLAMPARSAPAKRTDTEMRGRDRGRRAASAAVVNQGKQHVSETIHTQPRTRPAGGRSLQDSTIAKLGPQGNRSQLPENVDPDGQIRATIIRYDLKNTRRVHWDDIAGLEDVKKALQEAVVLPSRCPDIFSGLRTPATGMLLFGPPGTGKTMLAKAVATESKSTFFSVSPSSMTSDVYGGNEKRVEDLFHLAKHYAPSVIFIDEIDALLSQRSGNASEHEASRKTKTGFLTQWSDLESAVPRKEGKPGRVFILGATNLPWEIDEAVQRRFDRRQYIPLPEREVREQQLRRLFQGSESTKHCLCDSDFQQLARITEGYSCSDITALARDAAMGPIRTLGNAVLDAKLDKIPPVTMDHFEKSMGIIRASVAPERLHKFTQWAARYGVQNR